MVGYEEISIELDSKKIKNRMITFVYGVPAEYVKDITSKFKGELGCAGFSPKDKSMYKDAIMLQGDQIYKMIEKYKSIFKKISKKANISKESFNGKI